MSLLGRLFWSPMATKEQVEARQRVIRDMEWSALKAWIPEGSAFLDVGCGAGYNMLLAKMERQCRVKGIDPDPGAHGVGRYASAMDAQISTDIQQGMAEALPFEDNSFDVVFSSHVLEHVQDRQKSLEEMQRVAKPGAVIIVGMPTNTMSWLGLLAQWLFTTHIRIYKVFRGRHGRSLGMRLLNVFLPPSHSFPETKTVIYDLIHYRPSAWRRVVASRLSIQQHLFGGLYCYPDFPQVLSARPATGQKGSSVFFLCTTA